MKRLCHLILSALLILPVHAQQQDMKKQLDNYFKSYRPFGQLTRTASRLQSVKVNDTLRTIEICADSHFGEQVFTPQSAETIYENVQKNNNSNVEKSLVVLPTIPCKNTGSPVFLLFPSNGGEGQNGGEGSD